MTTDQRADASRSNALPLRLGFIGLVVLALALTQVVKLSADLSPNSRWQQGFVSFLFTVFELSLPSLLMWQRPAAASFDARLLTSGLKAWWWAFPVMIVVLLGTRACRPVTSMLDGVFGHIGTSRPVATGLIAPAVIVAETIRLVIITPIAEELFFRGLILGQLRKVMSSKGAVLVQAILFSACHLGPTFRSDRLVGAFVMGIASGAWRLQFSGLLPLMVVHAILNAMAFLPMAVREYGIVSLPECRQMEALKEEPAERAIPLIVEQLGNPDIRVQSGANSILTSRYRDAAGPYLREALSSSNPELVTATMRIIGGKNFRELIPEVRRLAWDHESQDVQIGAILQLMLLGETKELESIAADHPQPKIRRGASRLVAPRESP
ncbi:MAG: type II CAAX endopeptidase family protein [Planctomycetia bacterium]